MTEEELMAKDPLYNAWIMWMRSHPRHDYGRFDAFKAGARFDRCKHDVHGTDCFVCYPTKEETSVEHRPHRF